MARTLIDLERYDEAAEILEEARALLMNRPELQFLSVGVSQNAARLAARRGRPLDAITLMRSAIEGWEAFAPDHPRLLDARVDLARQLAEVGQTDKSAEILKALPHARGKGPITREHAAWIFFELAQERFERDRGAAWDLAATAIELFTETGQDEGIQAANAWLASHRPADD